MVENHLLADCINKTFSVLMEYFVFIYTYMYREPKSTDSKPWQGVSPMLEVARAHFPIGTGRR